jgi:hypothetical protein
MSFTFEGLIKNDYRPELGTNITIKKLEKEKIILQATKEHEFKKKQDSNTLSFTITPSSGGTEKASSLEVEVKNGKENVTTLPTHWELEITGTSDSTPVEVNIRFSRKQG